MGSSRATNTSSCSTASSWCASPRAAGRAPRSRRCEVFSRAFGAGFHARPQLPLALDDTSEPEPDVVVVQGGPWDYVRSQPSAPALVVEIAETSLAVDREHKSSLYARAGVTDYWIVQRLAPGASISPLAAPGAHIAIADLLPPA